MDSISYCFQFRLSFDLLLACYCKVEHNRVTIKRGQLGGNKWAEPVTELAIRIEEAHESDHYYRLLL